MPSLPVKVVSFALSHRSQVHDVFILMQFATSLAEAGQPADALTLFATLLRIERDKPVQRAVIKRCLEHCWGTCWDAGQGGSATLNSFAEAATKAERKSGSRLYASADTMRSRDMQDSALSVSGARGDALPGCGERSSWAVCVAQFVRVQQGMSSSEFVDVLQGMGVPRRELLAVCAELLDPSEGASAAERDQSDRSIAAATFALVPAMLQLHAAQLIQDLAVARDAPRSGQTAARAPDANAPWSRGSGAASRPGWWQARGGKALAIGSSVLGLLAPGFPGRLLSSGTVVWLAARVGPGAACTAES